MSGFLKFAIGVAVLGVVGLVGLSALSMVWVIVAHDAHGRVVAVEEVPARTVEVNEIERSVYDTFNAPAETPRSVQPNWGTPAQIEVNVHDSWFAITETFIPLILLIGMLVTVAIVIGAMRRGKSASPSDETALVHELARRAQDMTQRMEALETILLDRTRATR